MLNNYIRNGAAKAAAWSKRYAKDILIIILLSAAIPQMIVKNPVISYNGRAAKDMESIRNNKKRTLALILETSKRDYKEIFRRNVFTADGKYPADPMQQGEMKLTYKLIGILSSGRKVAVIADSEGRYYYRQEGQQLPDETVLSEVAMTSITLKNQEGEIKLKIFSVKK
ncbi:MAG: hypothetical protein L7F77_14935 [Candidatus Magnetominusculus sp. LBB02]|nr:hypothetical protein [Candidatus Magnetominusculus sp. LBB02]